MSKQTIARGIKTPLIKAGALLSDIIVESILKASKEEGFELNDRDVIGITESVVSISKNNYATLDDIGTDLNQKFDNDHLGIVFPILSRNRFAIMLRAFAKAKRKLTILLSYPSDEVGNGILDEEKMVELNINPYSDVLSEQFYNNNFGSYLHPYTGVNMVNVYKQICLEENCEVQFVFANNPNEILKYTNNVLVASIHSRFKTKEMLNKNENVVVYGLDDILTTPVNNSGYNAKYGLLGTNATNKTTVKLFPNDSKELLEEIQQKLFKLTNKLVEVMVYGDGAFKDPISGIWELADPVVSPSFTDGLKGSPNEVKLKYLIDNDFKDLKGQDLQDAIDNVIKNKDKDLTGKDVSLGTTPRSYVDLLGSLCDLISGSGDKGTPVVLIQNYFN